jgi:hypothetical protein
VQDLIMVSIWAVMPWCLALLSGFALWQLIWRQCMFLPKCLWTSSGLHGTTSQKTIQVPDGGKKFIPRSSTSPSYDSGNNDRILILKSITIPRSDQVASHHWKLSTDCMQTICRLVVSVGVTLRLAVYRQSVRLGVKSPWDPWTAFFFNWTLRP